jgi:hypothetical protein
MRKAVYCYRLVPKFLNWWLNENALYGLLKCALLILFGVIQNLTHKSTGTCYYYSESDWKYYTELLDGAVRLT